MAVQLDRMGHSVSVIDRSSDSFRRLPSDFNGRKVKGVGYDRDALEQLKSEGRRRKASAERSMTDTECPIRSS